MQQKQLSINNPTQQSRFNPALKLFLYILAIILVLALLICSLVIIFAFPFTAILTPIAISILLVIGIIGIPACLSEVWEDLFRELHATWQEIIQTTADQQEPVTNNVLSFPETGKKGEPNLPQTMISLPYEIFYLLFNHLPTRNLISFRGVDSNRRKYVDRYLLEREPPNRRMMYVLRHHSLLFNKLVVTAELERRVISFTDIYPRSMRNFYKLPSCISFAGSNYITKEVLISKPDKPDGYARMELYLLDFLPLNGEERYNAFLYSEYNELDLDVYHKNDFLCHGVLYQLGCLPSLELRKHVTLVMRSEYEESEESGKREVREVGVIYAYYENSSVPDEIREKIEEWGATVQKNAPVYGREKSGHTQIMEIRLPFSMVFQCLVLNPVFMAIMLTTNSFPKSLKLNDVDATYQFLISALLQFQGFSRGGISDTYCFFLKEALEKKYGRSHLVKEEEMPKQVKDFFEVDFMNEKLKSLTDFCPEHGMPMLDLHCVKLKDRIMRRLIEINVNFGIGSILNLNWWTPPLSILETILEKRLTKTMPKIRITARVIEELLDRKNLDADWYLTSSGQKIITSALTVLMEEVDQLVSQEEKLELLKTMLESRLFCHAHDFGYKVKKFFNMDTTADNAVTRIQKKILELEDQAGDNFKRPPSYY